MSSGQWPIATSCASSSRSKGFLAVSIVASAHLNSRFGKGRVRESPLMYVASIPSKNPLHGIYPVTDSRQGRTSHTSGEVLDIRSASNKPRMPSHPHKVEPNRSTREESLSLRIQRSSSKLSPRKAYQAVPERPGLSSLFRRSSHGLTKECENGSARRASIMLVSGARCECGPQHPADLTVSRWIG